MSLAIIMNLTAIAVIVAGWTAAVWVFYTRLDEGRALPRTARGREVARDTGTGPRPATRRDVRRAA